MGIGSVFASVYKELLSIKDDTNCEALDRQIEIDLLRTKSPISGQPLTN